MHIQLTLLTNNKQEVWLTILEFLRKNDCLLITQNIVEKGDQRIITVELESAEMLTSTDLVQLKKLSNDILFASTKTDENSGNKKAPPPSKESIEAKHTAQKRNNPFIVIAITTIVILGVGIYLMIQSDNIPVQLAKIDVYQASRANEKIILPDQAQIPLTLKTAPNDEESHRTQIEKLLLSAQKKIHNANLTKTSIDRALEETQEILQLDPNNKAAKQMLENIVTAYITLFEQAFATNDIQQAQQYLKKARNILPQHTAIQHAQKSLQLKEKEKQIDQLLELAIADTQALRLSKPKNNNALARYQQILNIDPNNSAAQQGIKNIANHYILLVKKAIYNQRWKRAEAFLSQASELNPDKQLSMLYQQKILTAKTENSLKNTENQQTLTEIQNRTNTDLKLASSANDNSQLLQAENISEKTKPINPIKLQLVQSKNKPTNNPVNKITSNRIVVIVHPSNPLSNISSKFLKQIYKGQISSWSSGGKVIVVNQTIDSRSRTAFYSKILNTTPETTFKNSSQYFSTTELSTFKTQIKKSDQAVKKTIRRNKKSIGYISLKNIDDSVKLINIDGVEPLSNGYILQ